MVIKKLNENEIENRMSDEELDTVSGGIVVARETTRTSGIFDREQTQTSGIYDKAELPSDGIHDDLVGVVVSPGSRPVKTNPLVTAASMIGEKFREDK